MNDEIECVLCDKMTAWNEYVVNHGTCNKCFDDEIDWAYAIGDCGFPVEGFAGHA